MEETVCICLQKGNFTLLYQLIKDYNWSDLFECRNVDDCLDLFYKIIYSMLDQAIPKYVVKETAHKPKYPFWYSPDLVRKIRNKNHLHKLIQKNRADSVQTNSYNALRQDTKHQINNEYRLHKQNIEANINQDPNSFWQFIRSKSRSSGVPGEMQWDGSVYSTPGDIANVFAQFFHSVYQVSENHSSFEAASDASSYNLPLVTESDVLVSIKN
ncbi:hypothetical protein JTB14_003877 [Gonioctena quinquepunctata]|nr:hypothetical protein JTB14_003877 [Gonioctena quinquepunctata]